ncbi:UNVERIFIED_CONTAM: DUF21 domain-containing protein [Sesamum latifolium]|uniref:DUF21 domain-containing protein n=1 Tax=Sesamum latifolium TaxID=2727402 RepID=A0AAW2T728_9LAMI
MLPVMHTADCEVRWRLRILPFWSAILVSVIFVCAFVEAGKGGDLTDDETTIISGALGMMEKIARDAMTPLSKAFFLDINSKLDMTTMKIIASKGHSRIPIYSDNPANIIGLILVKNLIFYHPEDETPIKDLTIRRIHRVYEDWPLYDVLKLFQEGHGHMAVVVKSEKDAKEASPKASNNSKKETNATGDIHSLGELLSHSPDNAMKRPRGPQQLNRWERRDGNISNEELESLKSRFIDEEGCRYYNNGGCIRRTSTDILDETDHHVEIHDKIRVRFVPSTRSPLSASRGTSLSSYYQTPLLGSPLPLYASPLIRSSIATSRVKPTVNSSRSFSAYLSSLSVHQNYVALPLTCRFINFSFFSSPQYHARTQEGLMSGLTLGLMSLSLVDLEVLIKAGKPEDRKNAAKILPIVKNQHLLLCTLLIWNALAMEALPIFVDALLPAWGAILISVTLILAFGEIIPQAVCSRYGLNIGARLSVIVRLLVIIVFPISYPISKLLDLLLGKGHSALLRRAELKTLVGMHGNEAGKGGELTHDETTIISGALDLTEKTAKDAMTPLSRVFSLDLNAKLDDDTMSLIISKGHSRVPIYSGSPTNIVGLVLIKNLIKCRPEDGTPIRNLSIRRIPRFHECQPLYDILNQFQKGQSHMAVVVKSTTPLKDVIVSTTVKSDTLKRDANPNSAQRQTDINVSVDGLTSFPNTDEEVLGIITMEDVLEQLLQEPIFDETDEYVDVHNKIKINLLPSVKLSSKSPGKESASQLNWKSPNASPYSSSHQTPISYQQSATMRSPLSPYSQSPITRPSLSASPGNSSSNSPGGIMRPHYGSPSTCQVSRKSYEKLRKPDNS